MDFLPHPSSDVEMVKPTDAASDPTSSNPGFQDPTGPQHSDHVDPAVSLVTISDFSPDWDFVKGGAKILICLATPLSIPCTGNDVALVFVMFGTTERVLAERLSDTVLRCTGSLAAFFGQILLRLI